MTLNGVMAVILRIFTEFGSFGADYVKVVEDRHIKASPTIVGVALIMTNTRQEA